ncbi:DEAD/DEAH box helicase domain protein [Desulfatibacillum aliphaticivorans]|uniref:DEAD/DEAH box helicase domain protein n=1 Tax=Desulfatibacillum aliphaticivorans TaxID=218208 RepID=B8FJX3_DESAL|nr:DEAD/DEAH box helicase [Desulfatibacillum aliphaticivorans]ACL02401.1 DEAD/DEAH box helicase domain protein [Desulfatibacillum aliphaticivorans]
MNVTKQSIEAINMHWAVKAIGEEHINRASEIADQILVENAVGEQIHFDFTTERKDIEILKKATLAYEMAAIEGMSDFLNPISSKKELREQCASGAFKAFEIRRLFEVPEDDEEKVFHILHLSALAYCGDRWTDLRRWYKENEKNIEAPRWEDASWDKRLLYRLFECWVCLFRKKGWDDLHKIYDIISELRQDQENYESGVLNESSNAENRAMALRLISLYHWAKASEIQAKYTIQGQPANVATLLDKHFESSIEAAIACADSQLEILLRWLHIAGRQMVTDSIWAVGQRINSRVTKFIKEATEHRALFELLPPQRAAIQELGLLDPAATAIVVDMPTSGGKTLLAQFRIMQALNQFDQSDNGKGWVAYVAPTKALTAQITRRLRRDFEPIGINVEQLTGAVEIDAFEEDLLNQTNNSEAFDVLVATPEKLQLIIRNKKVSRPLSLVVMDEAHNIEDATRGLRMELLLSTIKGECSSANFLLLMPYVENIQNIARWLAQDINAGRSISLGTTPWKPNERIVGLFKAEADDFEKAGWNLRFQTLTTTPQTIHLAGEHQVGGTKPLSVPRSQVVGGNGKQKGPTTQTAAMAKILSARGTSIAVATNPGHVWGMARKIHTCTNMLITIPSEILLVQKFLETEVSPDFELIAMLSHGIGVHHTGLSDEARSLIEWLAERGLLRVLCATTTIAQGINFPVSSVLLASNTYPPYGQEMTPREFWNLAGRAGRMGHDSVGVVGIAQGNKRKELIKFVSRSTGELVSRLLTMLDDLERIGKLNDLEAFFQYEQWEDFRCYIAHLWSEKKNLDAVLADTEQLLRNTLGYGVLERRPESKAKADKLIAATKNYARKLAENPGYASMADQTGFSPEGIRNAFMGMNSLERKLTVSDWAPNSLFGDKSGMADIYGVMLRIPQLRRGLTEITDKGLDSAQLSGITKAWVGGSSIEEIAQEYFSGGADRTKALTAACKAIYKNLVNNGTWGISALSRLSGIDFDNLPEPEKRLINMVPAMIYHGVQSEEGVLLRMNSVPRSIAESLGKEFKNVYFGRSSSVSAAREFLRLADETTWEKAREKGSALSGKEYMQVWSILSGESISL